MIPFLVFILILVIGTSQIYNLGRNDSSKRRSLIYAWIVITVFCGSNDAMNFGGDIAVYFGHAYRASQISLERYMELNPFEPGFCVYLWSIVHLFNDPQVFLFIQYGIVNGIILYFISKYADNPVYGVIGYVCLGGFGFYFTAMRQAMAMAICMIGLMQMLKGHWFRTCACILIATTFHVTAIVFIPVLFINKLKIKRNNILLTIICCIGISLFMGPLVNIGNEYMGETYGQSEYQFTSYTGPAISIIAMLASLGLIIRNRNRGIKRKFDNVFFYATMICLTLYLMRFGVLALERVAFYYSPIAGIGLSNAVNRYAINVRTPSVNNWYAVLAIVLFIVRTNNPSYRMIW